MDKFQDDVEEILMERYMQNTDSKKETKIHSKILMFENGYVAIITPRETILEDGNGKNRSKLKMNIYDHDIHYIKNEIYKKFGDVKLGIIIVEYDNDIDEMTKITLSNSCEGIKANINIVHESRQTDLPYIHQMRVSERYEELSIENDEDIEKVICNIESAYNYSFQ